MGTRKQFYVLGWQQLCTFSNTFRKVLRRSDWNPELNCKDKLFGNFLIRYECNLKSYEPISYNSNFKVNQYTHWIPTLSMGSKQNYWKIHFFVDKVPLRKAKTSNKIDKYHEVYKGYCKWGDGHLETSKSVKMNLNGFSECRNCLSLSTLIIIDVSRICNKMVYQTYVQTDQCCNHCLLNKLQGYLSVYIQQKI